MVQNEEFIMFYFTLRVFIEEYSESEESDTKEKREDGSTENPNDDIV